jgi:hypothetical protein
MRAVVPLFVLSLSLSPHPKNGADGPWWAVQQLGGQQADARQRAADVALMCRALTVRSPSRTHPLLPSHVLGGVEVRIYAWLSLARNEWAGVQRWTSCESLRIGFGTGRRQKMVLERGTNPKGSRLTSEYGLQSWRNVAKGRVRISTRKDNVRFATVSPHHGRTVSTRPAGCPPAPPDICSLETVSTRPAGCPPAPPDICSLETVSTRPAGCPPAPPDICSLETVIHPPSRMPTSSP